MTHSRRRRSAVLAALGLLAGLVPTLIAASPASAATQTTTNACLSNATATFSDIDITMAGAAAPNPVTLGATTTLSGASFQASVPATLLIAGYNLGLLTVGVNNIPVGWWVARTASNTVEATDNQSGSVAVATTITDPDGTPGTGDEGATPLNVSVPLANWTVTPTGGNVEFRQGGSIPTIPAGVAGAGAVTPAGSVFFSASVAGGLIRANFDCRPGLTDADGPDNILGNADDATTFTSTAPATAFETVVVNAPPTAPVCTNESASVGVTQSVNIDLTDNCSDVNGNIDLTTFSVSAPSSGTVTGSNGLYTYTAPAVDPGAPVVLDFTVADTTALVSNTAQVTITILANQCDATSAACSLTEIVVQPVVGTTMTLDKTPGQVIMSTVVLNGQPQASSGAIQQLMVTNARGSAAGWNVTGYVTDLGIAGLTPTFSPLPGVVVPACSSAGSFGLVTTPDRNCIPGDNMGWQPSAAIAHDRIAGDVAHVIAGPAHDTSAAGWLAQLIAAGVGAPASATPPSTVPGVNGLGGLQEANNLCGAPVNQSGGTFTCDASLFLGVPASAGAGTYTGGLVLTLL